MPGRRTLTYPLRDCLPKLTIDRHTKPTGYDMRMKYGTVKISDRASGRRKLSPHSGTGTRNPATRDSEPYPLEDSKYPPLIMAIMQGG